MREARRPATLMALLLALGCGNGGGVRGGSGGSGGSPPGPPVVDELSPSDGPWGSVVTILGTDLGSTSSSAALRIGASGAELVLTPDDAPQGAIESWTENHVSFRVPFPAEGSVTLETSLGSAQAGEFTPTWAAGPNRAAGPATEVIASLAPEEGVLVVLLASGELLEIGDAIVEKSVTAPEADLETAALYVSTSGEVEAVAFSKATPLELIHLAADASGLSAVPTGITGAWQEALISGGYAWLRDETGWSRASPKSGAWTIDVGPIGDPAPSGGLRAAAATSDGALHVVWNVETGDLFDDLEAPFMASVPAGGSDFGGAKQAGNSLDDYLTVLELEGRGAGMRLYWCGSDVDPVLGTPRESACDTLYVSSGGTSVEPKFKEDDQSRFVFTESLVGAAFCGADGALELTTDTLAESGEPAIWPCPRLLAAEIDPAGWFLPLIVHDDRLYSPRKRTE